MARLLYRRTGTGPPDAVFTSADGTVTGGWLDAGTKPAGAARYVFDDVLAVWLSAAGGPVKAGTARQWHSRYPGFPAAAAELAPEGRGAARLAWPEDARDAVQAWRRARPGQGGKGVPKGGTVYRPITSAERASVAAAREAIPPARRRGRDLRSPEGKRFRELLASLYAGRVRPRDLAEASGLTLHGVQNILRADGVPSRETRSGGSAG